MYYYIAYGHGGILSNVVEPSINGCIIWLLEIACYGAVNIYALITGYVYINSQSRYSKIIGLWLKVFFYSFFITLIYYFITPSTINISILIKSAFPIITKQYWYFTAYFGLFIFMPYLNILINNLNKQQHKALILCIILCFCIFNWLGKFINSDVFNLGNGYSFIWIISVYIIGAYLRLYCNDFEKYNKNKFLLIYICTTCITFLLRLFTKLLNQQLTGTFIKSEGMFVTYISPLILIGAVGLVIYFSRLEIKRFKKLIQKISQFSFSIYLISEQPNIKSTYILGRFAIFANMHPIILISNLIIGSLVIYMISLFIEYLRNKLFEKFKVNNILIKIDEYIDKTNSKFIKEVNI